MLPYALEPKVDAISIHKVSRVNMNFFPHTSSLFRHVAATALVCAFVAGCASAPRREAHWIDSLVGAQSQMYLGAKALVLCDAYDVAVQRICRDQLLREVAAKGATPVTLPAGTVLFTDRDLDGQLIESASVLDATAIFTMTLTPAASNGDSGFALGIGGFSFGRGSGGRVGSSAPIGGGGGSTVLVASGRLTDVRGNQIVWMATLVASPSADLNVQFRGLAHSLLNDAQSAGLV